MGTRGVVAVNTSRAWVLGAEGDQVVKASGTQSSVSLVVPCKPEYSSLGRLVAGSLGTQQGWGEEAVTDFKLVVSELCSFFFTAAESVRPESANAGTQIQATHSAGLPPVLRMDFEVDSDSWRLTVSNPDLVLRLPSAVFADPVGEGSLGLTIIRALVDSVERTDDDKEGTVFRVHKRLSAVATSED